MYVCMYVNVIFDLTFIADIKTHSRTISYQNSFKQSEQRRERCLICFVSTIMT